MKKLITITLLLVLNSNIALSKNINLLCKATANDGKKFTIGFNVDFNKFKLTDDNNDSHNLYIDDRSFISIISKRKTEYEVLSAIKIYRSSGKADIELYPLKNDQMDKLFNQVDIYLDSKDFLNSVDLSIKGNNEVTYAVFLALRNLFNPESSAQFMCEQSANKF